MDSQHFTGGRRLYKGAADSGARRWRPGVNTGRVWNRTEQGQVMPAERESFSMNWRRAQGRERPLTTGWQADEPQLCRWKRPRQRSAQPPGKPDTQGRDKHQGVPTLMEKTVKPHFSAQTSTFPLPPATFQQQRDISTPFPQKPVISPNRAAYAPKYIIYHD